MNPVVRDIYIDILKNRGKVDGCVYIGNGSYQIYILCYLPVFVADRLHNFQAVTTSYILKPNEH